MNERKRKYRRFLWCLLIGVTLGAGILIYESVRRQIPDEYRIFASEQVDWEEIFPHPLVTCEDAVETAQNGSYRIQCRFLGIFPLKEVKVTPVPKTTVYASGSPVGIYMETDGVLVVDSGEIRDEQGVNCSPAEHIVQPGDYIMEVNGRTLEGKRQLVELVKENQGEEMELGVIRHEEEITLAVTPVKTEEGDYKLGIWVRDNIQGIGTLTFVEGDGTFGALGHGISDIDTGKRLDISEGDLYQADILSVQKGVAGSPGELQGVIDYKEERRLGEISQNTANGITGKMKAEKCSSMHRKACEIGWKQEMKAGKAQILCDVGDGVKSYDIQITKIDWNTKDSNKSFVIQVTDPELLQKTGGIVQGMSGSPIMQDGKLIGAVTHVFVNDPTRGYGIFIENMMEH